MVMDKFVQELIDDAVMQERDSCMKLVCFDCRNYPERPIVYREAKGWMHQLIGNEYLCRATGIREQTMRETSQK